MEHHSFLYGALAVFSLLTLASAVHAFARWVKIPFAIGLLLSGIVLSLLEAQFSLGFFEYFHFSPEIVFYVFLPTLIFESAYHLNFRYFKGIFREATTLATFGLLISTGLIGMGLNLLLDMPLGVSFLFGALISATDPVAVLAIFKEVRAPEKLETVVDGESLLNDATALVLFQFMLGLVVLKETVLTGANSLVEIMDFVVSLVEGLGVGLIFGLIFSYAISKARTKEVQLALSLVLAHITFLIAQGVFDVSGILATMVAALVMGNFGKRKLKPETRRSFSEIWGFLGFISNALIFILLGIKIGQIDFALYWKHIAVAGGVMLLLARPLSVYISFLVTNLTRKKQNKISFSHQTVVMWGGIRGALAAAAVLLIPESFEYAELLQALTAGMILITFLLNGLTVSTLLKKLKIIDFSHVERMQHLEAKILISERITEYLESLFKRKYISSASFETLKERYRTERKNTQASFEKLKNDAKSSQREMEQILSHYALGIEKRTYKNLFELGEITEERFVALRDSIMRQIDFLEQNILPEERKATFQVAPAIPQKKDISQKIKSCCPKHLFDRYFDRYQKTKVLARMMHYRARRIASWRVINEFKKLKEKHHIFTKSHTISKIIHRYEGWHKNSEAKIKQLEKQFPDIINTERLRMAEQECLKREHEIEREFFEKGFLCHKVFEEMEEAVEKKESACKQQKGQFFSY